MLGVGIVEGVDPSDPVENRRGSSRVTLIQVSIIFLYSEFSAALEMFAGATIRFEFPMVTRSRCKRH